jgi:uncharacterized OB-fold protein
VTTRLAPSASLDSAFFWDAVREHKLLIQRCAGCGALRHPPRPMCPKCNSVEWDTIESTGRGELFSFVMPHHPAFPWFDYPYIVALVELEEGIRFVANLVDITPEETTIGMPVVLGFEHHDNDVVLPVFRPAGADGSAS